MRNLNWIELGSFCAALVVLIGLPASAFAYDRIATTNSITLVGHIAESGGWSQKTIRVEEGQRVQLRLTSHDVAHGFVIDETDIGRVHVDAGKFTTVDFTAPEAGIYVFHCTVVCSPEHGLMTGKLVVTAKSQAALPGLTNQLARYLTTFAK